MPDLPFMTLFRACRVTPRIFAPSVTDKPKGSRHARRMLPPGWGGLFIGIIFSSSVLVVVYQFNVKDVVSFKSENDAPIGPHRDRPQSLQVAFERVQPIAGKVHS